MCIRDRYMGIIRNLMSEKQGKSKDEGRKSSTIIESGEHFTMAEGKSASKDREKGESEKEIYMLISCKHRESLNQFTNTGYWPVTKSQSKKLTSAFESVSAVYIVAINLDEKMFLGIGKMESPAEIEYADAHQTFFISNLSGYQMHLYLLTQQNTYLTLTTLGKMWKKQQLPKVSN
eukprot:TRINITY_DN6011_c0_g1_i1.p2 TRINITY_DN6011_c0_g1~~TRINITY_DN6011_c0_g1_i1.p2  ORF type:complete len:176 (+),score=22.09 TRINITY_DN6011_c0_g1_i1:64-591(+)